ncbi:DUF5063 domain-containing protein [Novosphingobium aquiterrae]|uniref:DUF5063 domain-containing protein n=1 Tax=Novosphingobium aquiterrae TaxID=624388 RepID=A0ABV6PDY8_9SPHN
MDQSERLDHASIRGAIEAYLSLIDGQAKVDLTDYSLLAVTLDRLVLEYHITESLEPSDSDIETPEISGAEIYSRAGKSFPELGLYPWADVNDEPGSKPGVADAIDDLADIARDLLEVLWYFDQNRIQDGIWQFRWGYQNHWGAHLHKLRVLLHSPKICAW